MEQDHIVAAFRFELGKVTVPAIRERMVSSLIHVSTELAAALADGLGMALPAPMARALDRPATPEVIASPALSLTALPGDGGIRTRRVALLLADGVHVPSLAAMMEALQRAGASVHLVARRLGAVKAGKGKGLVATATFETAPAVLFDGVVLPDGQAAVDQLAADPQAMEFVGLMHRHGKTMLALGAASQLFERLGVAARLASGEADPGVLLSRQDHGGTAAEAFIGALARHRHPEREAP